MTTSLASLVVGSLYSRRATRSTTSRHEGARLPKSTGAQSLLVSFLHELMPKFHTKQEILVL